MLEASLKKSIAISFIGHLAVLALFGFSFGKKLFGGGYSPVYFWGQLLNNSQIIKPEQISSALLNKMISVRADSLSLDTAAGEQDFVLERFYSKPNNGAILIREKELFYPAVPESPPIIRRQEPSILFHPALPYSFALYFQDRQVVHVELAYNIVPSGAINSIIVKRKISSGNLEVDLLSMRYINRYLFMQQARISPNQWRSVKIDLSAKDK